MSKAVWDEVKAELGEGPEYVPRSAYVHASDKEAFKAARDAYYAHQNALMAEWRRRVRAQHPEVSDAVFELVYAKAYEDGHSAGYGEVELYISDYVEFATEIISAAKG